ncbi:MAG: hypothetical protein AMXMBFR84_00480 [Candidatus Hydrogenedentota bacterium]
MYGRVGRKTFALETFTPHYTLEASTYECTMHDPSPQPAVGQPVAALSTVNGQALNG